MYIEEKKAEGNPNLGSTASNDAVGRTSKKIAVRSGKSRATVERAAALVDALERIARASPKGRMDYVEGAKKQAQNRTDTMSVLFFSPWSEFGLSNICVVNAIQYGRLPKTVPEFTQPASASVASRMSDSHRKSDTLQQSFES